MKATERRATAHSVAAVAIGILAVLLAAASASAQQSDQGVEFQSYRVPGWSFTPSVAFGTIFDTNVGLTAPRATLGETQGDSLFNVVPGGQLEFIGRRTDFSASYRGFLRRYFEVEGLDGFDQRAALGFKRGLTRRLTVFVQDSFADSPTTDEVELNGVPFRRTGSRTNVIAAGSEYRFTRRTTLATRYDMTWVSFDRPDILLSGGQLHGLRNELTHQVTRQVSLGGEFGYRTASLDNGRRELAFQDVGGVVDFALGPRTTGSAAAGFAALQDRTASERRTGPYARVGVSHTLEYATVGASFERQYVPSFGFGGPTSSQELRGYVRMPLGHRRLYTQGSAVWRRSLPLEDLSLELDTIVLRSTVGYSAARWARVEALYTFTRQDPLVAGDGIDRHRIGIQFVVSQPMRFP